MQTLAGRQPTDSRDITFPDTGLTPGIEYTYRARAFRDSTISNVGGTSRQYSDWSDEVSGRTWHQRVGRGSPRHAACGRRRRPHRTSASSLTPSNGGGMAGPSHAQHHVFNKRPAFTH